MNENDLAQLLQPVIGRIVQLAQTDPELRQRVRQLGLALVATTAAPHDDLPETRVVTPSQQATTQPSVEKVAAPVSISNSLTADKTVEKNGAGKTAMHMPTPASPSASPPVEERSFERMLDQVIDQDLETIVERCRLKVRAARLNAERLRGDATLEQAALTAAEARSLIQSAKLLSDCYLWMMNRGVAGQDGSELYERLSGCYDATAEAAGTLYAMTLDESVTDEDFRTACTLAAETQSALRQAVSATGYKFDSDQLRLFYWIRSTALEHRFFISRYMQKNDVADADTWPDLISRIQTFNAQRESKERLIRERSELLNKANYHAGQIAKGRSGNKRYDWDLINKSIVTLCDGGMQPSNPTLRELLLPILDDMPDDLPHTQSWQLVLREIDRYQAGRTELDIGPAQQEAPSEDVRCVKEMLKGRSLVLIGGVPRPAAKRALETAFSLQELLWEEAQPHQSHTLFERDIARRDVVAVLLAIRWSSHHFAEAKEYCHQYDKPLIRLRAGYNPNEVARQILDQASDRLRITNSQ